LQAARLAAMSRGRTNVDKRFMALLSDGKNERARIAGFVNTAERP
jgi:hypothetical protein